MKAFVYKLRPTPSQEVILEEALETCRYLYNHTLAQRKDAWEQEGCSVGFAEKGV